MKCGLFNELFDCYDHKGSGNSDRLHKFEPTTSSSNGPAHTPCGLKNGIFLRIALLVKRQTSN